jgi:hypothetical protein
MADYAYTQNTGNLKAFLSKIQDVGIPDKVKNRYLESLGYKSTNDRTILGVLKFLGFIDSDHKPTDLWNQYREKAKSKSIMAGIIRNSYSDLYKTYPDAHRKDYEALRDFFSTKTSVGVKALQCIIKTFKALSELADFESDFVPTLPSNQVIPPIPPANTHPEGKNITVNLNIELAIPATDDPKIYENFFMAFKKYLIDNE